MRNNVIELFVNNVEQMVVDRNMTEDEISYAFALLMMGQIQHQNDNPMNIVMCHDLTLRVGLILNAATDGAGQDNKH